MGEYGRRLIIVFLVLTVLLLLMESCGIDGNLLTFARYLVVLLLSMAAYLKRGPNHEQKVLLLAFPLMLIGDFFLVVSYSIGGFPENFRYAGFIPFTIAYLIITRIYAKGFKWNPWLLLPTVIYGLLLMVVGFLIFPHLTGLQRTLGSMVALALTSMAWTGASTVCSGYYSRKTSIMMGLSGFLMLICDYGVAFDLFYPEVSIIRIALPLNIVWLAYIPGWTLLALVVAQGDIFATVYEQ